MKANQIKFSPIATLAGDAHIMGLNEQLIREALAEQAALQAVVEAAKRRVSGSRADATLARALANLAALREGGAK